MLSCDVATPLLSPQVLGHTKTILVLLISWLVLHEPMTHRKLLGMCLAVVGMTAYSHATLQANSQAAAAAQTSVFPNKQQQQPLLQEHQRQQQQNRADT